MKKFIRALCAGLLVPVLPARAGTYDDIVSAATNAQDLSRQALVTIFGDVVLNPMSAGNTTMIGNLFALFNGIIAVLAVIWFIFIGLRHINKTGHQGKVFSGDRDITSTLSTVSGFFMIIPTANGWSMAQLIMLWGASVMGVGSANLMVTKAASDIASGYSMTVQPTQASTRTSARGIFEMQLCKHAINMALDDYSSTASSTTPRMTEVSGSSGGNYTYRVTNGSGVCGTASIPEQKASGSSSSLGSFLNPFSDSDTRDVVAAQHKAMDAMIKDMDGAASEFLTGFIDRRVNGTGTIPDIETRIQRAAGTYEQTVQRALPAQGEQNGMQDTLRNYLDTYGWAALGAWYQTFATANQRLTEVASRAPATSGMSSLGEIGSEDLFNALMGAYRTQLQNSSYSPVLGTVVSNDEQTAGDGNDPNSVLMKTMAGPMQGMTNYFATSLSGTGTENGQVNPLIKMKKIGDYTLISAEGTLTAFTAARVLAAAGEGNLIGKVLNLSTGTVSGINKGLDAISPAVYFLLLLMFTAGFTLSIYLPFIPFIFWMTGIGNWIVSVLVGCAAGPLWGATHLGTSQDRGSRAAYGYIYFIDTMIRPTLMVFGFFFASVAIIAVGTILHALFGAALLNVQSDSLTGVFSLIGFLMIYARLCTALVSSMFALQAYLPDYVISFLGGRDAANTLGSMAGSMKEMFAGGTKNIRNTPGVNTKGMNGPSDNNKDGIQS
ncbi:TPA: DotA/TraY family protein [Klebsiella michiganensis]|uniref:DotA/TraY family protein n=1 Tax=Enterobacter roggenkampii TaxID=1812935 RepID=UPI00064B5B72|nr:DotA/TraY family protein [Enterobacter roggenkampii]EME1808863.1 DotA/TraY family protein [Cronobacter sakazakii]KLP31043.1 membrane protein [Enterobacter roggenkampii]HAV1652573.1 DotA/TraY family protein [Enterobacter hormaechei subsp. xiangfangensis]